MVSSEAQTICGLTKKRGCFGSSPREMSMTMTRLATPTWMAARPMPGAAYMVASMSSISRRRSSSTAATGADFCFSTARSASTVRIGKMVIFAEVGAPIPSVKIGFCDPSRRLLLAGGQLDQPAHAGLHRRRLGQRAALVVGRQILEAARLAQHLGLQRGDELVVAAGGGLQRLADAGHVRAHHRQ